MATHTIRGCDIAIYVLPTVEVDSFHIPLEFLKNNEKSCLSRHVKSSEESTRFLGFLINAPFGGGFTTPPPDSRMTIPWPILSVLLCFRFVLEADT